MSKRSEGLITDFYSNGFVARSAPAAGTTCVATVTPANPMTRANVEYLTYSVKNTTAAAFTVTATVSDASIGGTVLADWDFIVTNGVAAQGSLPLDLPGLRGNAVVASITPPASSVVQKVSIGGWFDGMVNG